MTIFEDEPWPNGDDLLDDAHVTYEDVYGWCCPDCREDAEDKARAWAGEAWYEASVRMERVSRRIKTLAPLQAHRVLGQRWLDLRRLSREAEVNLAEWWSELWQSIRDRLRSISMRFIPAEERVPAPTAPMGQGQSLDDVPRSPPEPLHSPFVAARAPGFSPSWAVPAAA